MRCVRDERALAGEGVGEPVEHVVEGIGETRTSPPWPSRSWMRGCRSPASTWAATAAMRRNGRDTRGADQKRGEQRTGEREDAGEDEGAGDPSLGMSDCEQGLAHATSPTRASAPSRRRRLSPGMVTSA